MFPSSTLTPPVSIRLAEAQVFLRGAAESSTSASRRRRGAEQVQGPAVLRGLLSVSLDKPTKVSSIELEFEGKTRSSWPEGIGSRRVEVTEEHTILHSRTVYFKADKDVARRTASVGPGVALEGEEQSATPPWGRSPNPSPTVSRQASRRMSTEYHNFQSTHVSHHPLSFPHHDLPETPPYTPVAKSPIAQELLLTPSNVNSNLSQEEFRRNLQANRDFIPHLQQSGARRHSTASHSSASTSTTSFRQRNSLQQENVYPSTSQPQARSPDRERGRRSNRFSLPNVTSMLKDVSEAIRVRSKSPRTKVASTSRGDSREPSLDGWHRPGRASTRTPLHTILASDTQSPVEGAVGDGWKEFRKGTYTYPISFTIPSGTPPTLHTEYGSVTYKLKATVHRPGAFKSKLTAVREVDIVACPGEDEGEETETIIVERQWDDQLRYLISIAGRAFPIGSTIPLSLTLLPLTKLKVYRITVLLEERVEYYTHFKRVARQDLTKRFELLSLRLPDNNAVMLPMNPEHFDSPLIPYGRGEDPDDVTSTLMGPGPWTLDADLVIPTTCNRLHSSNKHKRSNISVGHHLKLLLRVERGDEQEPDPKTRKRRLYDIVIQTPLQILSCRCQPAYMALPPYAEGAEYAEETLQQGSCACTSVRRGRRLGPDADPVELVMTTHESGTPTPSDGRALLAERTSHFARLVAGEETPDGEHPPVYQVTAT